MTLYLQEELFSLDHFDIWDEQDQLVYSADREFFTFGKKLNVEDASGRQIAVPDGKRFRLEKSLHL